jgi:hypothetical protein
MICVVELGMMAISIGISLLAGMLLKKKVKSPLDDKPTTLTTRGSYVPWLLGQRVIAPVFAWAGQRNSKKEKLKDGGKGIGGVSDSKTKVFYEAGWHQICIGPVDELYQIRQNGAVIFEGPISRTSHPSGSLVELADREGSFYIYWGEEDQPVNTFLGDAARVGISSRWAGLCYVVWWRKRLGPSPQWPQLEYVINVKPRSTLLEDSEGYCPATWTIDTGYTWDILGVRPINAIRVYPKTVGSPPPGGTYSGIVPESEVGVADLMTPVVITHPARNIWRVIPGDPTIGHYILDPLIVTNPEYFQTDTDHDIQEAGVRTIRRIRSGSAVLSGEWTFNEAERLAPGTYNITKIFPAGGVSGADAAGHVRKHYHYFSPDGTRVDHYFNIPIVSYSDGVEGTGYIAVGGNWSEYIRKGEIELSGNGMADGTYALAKASEYVEHHASWDEEDHSPALVVEKNQTWWFPAGQVLRIKDNSGIPDGDYIVLRSEDYEGTTRVYLEQDVTTVEADGQIEAWYYRTPDFGVNPAHAIAEMLFSSWPYGLGLDQSEWDLDSLEEVGSYFDPDIGQRLFTSWLATEGEEIEALLGAAMQDLGLAIIWDTATGKHRFRLIRDPEETSPTEVQEISDDLILEPLPQIETLHADQRPNRLIFAFPDRQMNYRTSTIAIDDDGQAGYLEYQKAQEVKLTIVDHIDPAAIVAERRSQEELAGGSAFTFNMNRSARELLPGDVLLVEGFDELLRVTGVEFQGDEGTVKVECITDIFGTPVSTFRAGQGALPSPAESPEEDLAFRIFEIPEHLSGKGNQYIGVPRIRANQAANSSDIYLSLDDLTYTYNSSDYEVHSGGTLIDALAADDPSEVDEGPTFTIQGPDILDAVEDLTGDDYNWRAGRQVALIGDEICFFKKITAISGTTYRIDGLIRARFDTRKAAHAGSTQVYLFLRDNLNQLSDLLLSVGADLYLKSVPAGVSADVVDPDNRTLYGKGVRPMAPANLRLSAPFSCLAGFKTGNDLAFNWEYLSSLTPRSGAGMQGYGAICGESAVDGEFRLEILNALDEVKRTVLTTDLTYSYSNANMVSDFTSEPSSLKARLTMVRGGLDSDSVTLEIARL